MAKFKKLIPALCMLLVSAVMLGTSTFAWFSMNTSVQATGMSVQAKSGTTYLMISTSATTGYNTAVSFSASASTEVYPIAYTTTAIPGTSGSGNVVEANNWYTASSTTYNSSNTNVTGYQTKVLGDTGYFLTQTVYLALSKDSAALDSAVTMTLTHGSSAHEAIKVAVRVGGSTGTVYYLEKDVGTTSETQENVATTSSLSLKPQGNAGDAVQVEIFVYIDGTHADVNSDWFNNDANKTSGKTNLSGDISITFSIA